MSLLLREWAEEDGYVCSLLAVLAKRRTEVHFQEMYILSIHCYNTIHNILHCIHNIYTYYYNVLVYIFIDVSLVGFAPSGC